HDRIRYLFLLVGNLHHRNMRRPEQPINVLGEAKDGGPFATLITADAFERGQPVVEGMSQDMHRGIRPVDELAVHPDFFAWLQHNPKGTIAVPRNSCQRTRRRDRRDDATTQHSSALEFLSTRDALTAHPSGPSRAESVCSIYSMPHALTLFRGL